MKTMPIIQCRRCNRFLEFERSDVKTTHRWNRIRCHACNSQSNVPKPIFNELFPELPPAPEKPPAPPKPVEAGKPPEESVAAFIALLAHDMNFTATATTLGVVPQTVKNRIARLTEDQKNELKSAGMVPAATVVE